MKALKITFIICTLSVFMASTALAAHGPTDFLKSIDGKLKPLMSDAQKNEVKIIKLINKMLNFDSVAQNSLGKHWSAQSTEQQKEFADTLKQLIEKSVSQRLESTKSNSITYISESVKGNKATVVTEVKDGDGPRATVIEIKYTLHKSNGKWSVVDMVTDGVSLVNNYRSQFNKLINEEGWDGMMKKMKDKLAELNK